VITEFPILYWNQTPGESYWHIPVVNCDIRKLGLKFEAKHIKEYKDDSYVIFIHQNINYCIYAQETKKEDFLSRLDESNPLYIFSAESHEFTEYLQKNHKVTPMTTLTLRENGD
jgi:hypothetical protein